MMSNEVDNNSDVDIYAGLPDFNYSDKLDKLEKANASLTERVKSLENELFKQREDKIKYEALNKTLSMNISSLYKTAFSEIQRKDRMLNELRKRFDNAAFRRRTNFSSKYTIETHSTTENYVAIEGNVESRYQEEKEEEINVKKIYLSHNFKEKDDFSCVEPKQNPCIDSSLLLTEYSKRMHRRLLGELSANNQNSGKDSRIDKKCLPGVNKNNKMDIDNFKPKRNNLKDMKSLSEKKCDLCSPQSKCNCNKNRLVKNNQEIDTKNNDKYLLDNLNRSSCIALPEKVKTVVKSIFDDDTIGSLNGDGFNTASSVVNVVNAPSSNKNVESVISNLEGVNDDRIQISGSKTTENTLNVTSLIKEVDGISQEEQHCDSSGKGETCLDPNKSHVSNNDKHVNNCLTDTENLGNQKRMVPKIDTKVVLQKQDITTKEYNSRPFEDKEKIRIFENNKISALELLSNELQTPPVESTDEQNSTNQGVLDIKPEDFQEQTTSTKIDNPVTENLSGLIERKPCDNENSSSNFKRSSINSGPVIKTSDGSPNWNLIQIDMPLKSNNDPQKNDEDDGNKNVPCIKNIKTSGDKKSVLIACTKSSSNKVLHGSIKNKGLDSKTNWSKNCPKQNQDLTKFLHAKLLRKSKQSQPLIRPISLQWKSAATQKDEIKTIDEPHANLKTHSTVKNHNTKNETNTLSGSKTCKSKNNLLESLFGSPLKWSDTDSTDDHKIDISSPTVYEDSCSAQLENPKFKIPLENNGNKAVITNSVNGIKKCMMREVTKKSHSFENHFVPDQTTGNICKSKMNDSQKSVSDSNLLDVTTAQTDSVIELKSTATIAYDKTPIKAKYDDSLLGQFEDTNQLISALTKVHETISPINTPLKEDKELDTLSPVEKLSDNKHTEINPTDKKTLCETPMISARSGTNLTKVVSNNTLFCPVVGTVDLCKHEKSSTDNRVTGFNSLPQNVSENTSAIGTSKFSPNKFQTKINILQPRKTPRNINSHKPKEPPKKISAFPQQKLNELSVLTYVKDTVKRRLDHFNNNDLKHGRNLLLKAAHATELSSIHPGASKMETKICSAALSDSISNNGVIANNSGMIENNITSSTASVNTSSKIVLNHEENHKALEGTDHLNVSDKVSENKLCSSESNNQVLLAKEEKDKYNINGFNKDAVNLSENKNLNKFKGNNEDSIRKNHFKENLDDNKAYQNTCVNETEASHLLSLSPKNKSKSLNNEVILTSVNHLFSPEKKSKPVITINGKSIKKGSENSINSKFVDKQLSGRRVNCLNDGPTQTFSHKRRVYRNSPNRKSDRDRVDIIENKYRSRNRRKEVETQRPHWRNKYDFQYKVKIKSHSKREYSSELLENKQSSPNCPRNDRYYEKYSFHHKRKNYNDDDRHRRKKLCQEVSIPNKIAKKILSDDSKILNANKVVTENAKNLDKKMEVCNLNKRSTELENNKREIHRDSLVQKTVQLEKSVPIFRNHMNQTESNQSRIIIRTSRRLQWSTTTNVAVQKCISDTDNADGTKLVKLSENETGHGAITVSKNPSNGSNNGSKMSIETKERSSHLKITPCNGKEYSKYVKDKSTDNVQMKNISHSPAISTVTTPEKVIVRKSKTMNFSENELTSTPTFIVKDLPASTPKESRSGQVKLELKPSPSTIPVGNKIKDNQSSLKETSHNCVKELYPSVFTNSDNSLSDDLRFTETSSSSCLSDETWKP